jgi:hypothetical protein
VEEDIEEDFGTSPASPSGTDFFSLSIKKLSSV